MRLNLPQHELKIKKTSRSVLVWDRLRRRYVTLTPEEEVRQCFVEHLVNDLHYPAARMGNEMSLVQNGIKRRCDTLVADSMGRPLVIVEYKAPSIAITQAVFDQIVRYNMVLRASYLIVSNGLNHYCCRMRYETGDYEFLREIPDYSHLSLTREITQ